MTTNALKKNEPAKAYAHAQLSELWTLERFAQHIAKHNGVYSRGTVKGVISDMCECLVEQLLAGNKVQFGELGNFSVSLSSEGAASLDDFTAKNIKAVNIVFTPGSDFDNLINEAEFNLVASRAAQAATLAAEKAGSDTVDLAAAKAKKNSTDTGTGNTGSESTDPDNSSDNGSDSGSTTTPSQDGNGSIG